MIFTLLLMMICDAIAFTRSQPAYEGGTSLPTSNANLTSRYPNSEKLPSWLPALLMDSSISARPAWRREISRPQSLP